MGIKFKKITGDVSAETVRNRVIDDLSKYIPDDLMTYERNYMIEIDCIADKERVPLAVVKCLSSDEKISDNVIRQTKLYAENIEAIWTAVTNGKKSVYFHNNTEIGWYSIKCMPYWINMCMTNYHWWDMLEDIRKERINIYVDVGIIGNDTPADLQAAMVNLWECLLDTEFTFPVEQYDTFRMIKDIGIKFGIYGNPSNGKFEGLYRSFLIEFEGIEQFISIGMSGYCTDAKPDIIKTAICVAIDNENKSHHALQLVVDNKHLNIFGDTVYFQHDGKIGNAPKGSSIKELKLFIERYCPHILKNNNIYLGKLQNNRLWNISDSDVSELIENLISYALIRDKYKNYIKSGKNKSEKFLINS